MPVNIAALKTAALKTAALRTFAPAMGGQVIE